MHTKMSATYFLFRLYKLKTRKVAAIRMPSEAKIEMIMYRDFSTRMILKRNSRLAIGT